ncbi:MAG: 4Fe-4S single cluster domain-containing protein [Spirochaetota bacterium]|nr:4Fe-4S single cluster domain-containing protein [Spirochaetota bacterium]
MKLRLHNIIQQTRVNGPGNRFGIWVQGCNLNCSGCFNPQTHSFDDGYEIYVDELFKQIIHYNNIEGISISGGEPLLQGETLLYLLNRITKETDLTILIYTGYTYDEIIADRIMNKLLSHIDIIIAGPYKESLKINNSVLSSSNQEVYFLTDRYTQNDLDISNTEVIIGNNGAITLTGLLNITDF